MGPPPGTSPPMRMTASWFRSSRSTAYKVVARSPRPMARSPRHCRRVFTLQESSPDHPACRCARDRQRQVRLSHTLDRRCTQRPTKTSRDEEIEYKEMEML